MRRARYPLKKIEKIQADVFCLTFSAPSFSSKAVPGQFLHFKVDSSVILRRPLSIHDIYRDEISVLFRVRGKGTESLSRFKPGDRLDIIGPLGNGFSLKKISSYDRIYLLAGGIGVAPLFFLAKVLNGKKTASQDQKLTLLLGAASKKELLCAGRFKQLGWKVKTITDDGSCGRQGLCLDLLEEELNKPGKQEEKIKIYACGPEPMFKSLAEVLRPLPQIDCEVSFEQFMGCGIGICLGCVISTRQGYKRVCKDGPVFNIKDVF